MERETGKNLIFGALAFSPDKCSGENLKGAKDKLTVYLKGAVVSLVSAKTSNPEVEVALVTDTEIPQRFLKIFDKFGVKVFHEEFDEFSFGVDYKWGLAFYKLCALKKMSVKGYSSCVLIDLDTYTQSSLIDLFEETKHNVILYDINHRLSLPNTVKFEKEVAAFLEREEPITNFGGEFIAGSGEKLLRFIEIAENVYNEMLKKNFATSFGDEFIISIAAYCDKQDITCGGYVQRFWTGDFRLVSDLYKNNAVSIIHVPAEKTDGLIKIFNKIEKKGKIKPAKAHKYLHLNKPKFTTVLKRLAGKI